jgi:predicted transcriptional regulator
MPRVRVSVPDELLQHAATMAERLERPLDELCVEAIEGYVDAHQDASAGSMRSRRAFIPRGSPQISVQIPDDLIKRADTLGKRLEKRRDVLYAEALTRHVLANVPEGDSAFDRGHDLPSGAWRPKGPAQEPDPS